jgi:4,5-DOPA dioxygenase extradiol
MSEKIYRWPVLFLGHGSPMNAIENNEFTQGWSSMAQRFPVPKAILCISAHWETRGTMVTAMEHPKTIHDFSGFPRHLYDVQYPAAGSPELARELSHEIKGPSVEPDHQWGLDHGCWSVIRHLYPRADVPVVQLSIDHYRTPQQHYDLAKELYGFREKGVLIIGSGNMVHNLGLVAWDRMNEPEYGYDWALEANELIKKYILTDAHKDLIQYKDKGQALRLAVPTPEHFLPLLYVLALKSPEEEISLFNDKAVMGSLTMTSVAVGI